MKRYREIYRAGQLPAFQNRTFHSEHMVKNCIKGDVVLAQDSASIQFSLVKHEII